MRSRPPGHRIDYCNPGKQLVCLAAPCTRGLWSIMPNQLKNSGFRAANLIFFGRTLLIAMCRVPIP